jgi:hypothetical protein
MNRAITESNSVRFFTAVGLVVLAGVIAFLVWSYIREQHLTSQAVSVATTFVRSSPRVQTDLGTVVNLEEKSADRLQMHDGALRWHVDLNVQGKKGRGFVEVLVRSVGGEWNVPAAELREGGAKPISLL